jgi:hypothetical protein
MGIPSDKWLELNETMKPYVARFLDDDLTFEEYNSILSKKLNEFLLKYSQ